MHTSNTFHNEFNNNFSCSKFYIHPDFYIYIYYIQFHKRNSRYTILFYVYPESRIWTFVVCFYLWEKLNCPVTIFFTVEVHLIFYRQTSSYLLSSFYLYQVHLIFWVKDHLCLLGWSLSLSFGLKFIFIFWVKVFRRIAK